MNERTIHNQTMNNDTQPNNEQTNKDEQTKEILYIQQSNYICNWYEDTMFGRKVVLKKRELKAAAGHFTRREMP